MTNQPQDVATPSSASLASHLDPSSETGKPSVSTYVAGAVYGLITVLAVLQTMQLHPPKAWQAAVTVFGTTLVIALIDVYADAIGALLGQETRLTRNHLVEFWHEATPVLVGAQGPTVVLILSALGVMSVDRAIDVAQVVAFATLFAYGWRIGQKLDVPIPRRVVSGLVLIAIGGVLVLIKAAFH